MAVAKSNHNLIFVAGQTKLGSQYVMGVHKSTDGGNSWKAYAVKSQKGICYSLAVDPKDPSNVFVGGYIGDYKGSMFKSINGGQSWQEIGKKTFGKKYDYINRIVIDPNDSSRLYVATNRGLFTSSNFGSSWSNIANPAWGGYGYIDSILVDPKSPKKIYAARYSGVYYSSDRGSNWFKLDNKLTMPAGLCLALNQAKSYLFVGTQGGGIFRSVVKKLN